MRPLLIQQLPIDHDAEKARPRGPTFSFKSIGSSSSRGWLVARYGQLLKSHLNVHRTHDRFPHMDQGRATNETISARCSLTLTGAVGRARYDRGTMRK